MRAGDLDTIQPPPQPSHIPQHRRDLTLISRRDVSNQSASNQRHHIHTHHPSIDRDNLNSLGPQRSDRPGENGLHQPPYEMGVTEFSDLAGVRVSFVDDGTGLAAAWEALQAGQYGEAARTSTRTITDLVFTSPTEAWFRYDIETSIMNFYNRYGMAKLNADGRWQITRQTMCQDVALAPGFGCDPPVDQLLPPSAANDPRYGDVTGEETLGAP